MVKQVNQPYDLRLRLVQSAKQIGVKPTARLYGTSPQTVRLWVRRYAEAGRKGLASRSHAPHSCPHRTPAHLEEEIVGLVEAQTSSIRAWATAEGEVPDLADFRQAVQELDRLSPRTA